MNVGQGITMQKVVGETVKPQEFRVDQIRDVSPGFYLGGMARLTLIRWLYGKTGVFGALASMRAPLTVDSPSATRADREAPLWKGWGSRRRRNQLTSGDGTNRTCRSSEPTSDFDPKQTSSEFRQ